MLTPHASSPAPASGPAVGTFSLIPSTASADARLEELCDWLRESGVLPDFTLAPASADASFRRYFRAHLASPWKGAADATTLIAMDAPPTREDCRPFVQIAKLLANAGVHAPQVLAADLPRGYLLLTDLGSRTYASALDLRTAHALYADALEALVRWQCASRDNVLPPYDDALLRREIALFPEWYVEGHLAYEMSDNERAALAQVFDAVIANNLAQPRVYVHRDYHSRNLMVTTPNPGVLDFQDAVHGAITYDLVSLLRDAYVEWDEELQLDWSIRYWEQARSAGLPVDADFATFWRDFEWMGIQRQLKVLGIFARLNIRDGKARYVADMPRVLGYLKRAASRYPEFDALVTLLDALDAHVEARQST